MIEKLVVAVLLGGAATCAVIAAGRWVLDARHNVDDEAAIEALRGTALAEALGGRVEDHLRDQGLATEEDARLWGFEPDWMAVERLELCRAWWAAQSR